MEKKGKSICFANFKQLRCFHPISDLATRQIITHYIQFRPPKGSPPEPLGLESRDLIVLIEKLMLNRNASSFIFNSDKGGSFISSEFSDYLFKRKVNQSFATERLFGNQFASQISSN